MARTAISAAIDDDDELAAQFRGNNDPDWAVTPSAKRKKRDQELAARLKAEKKKKSWF